MTQSLQMLAARLHLLLFLPEQVLQCLDSNEAFQPRPDGRGFFLVRPARAHSWRCKSSRELITANEVKRNCMRVTECGEEAWSEAAS